MNAIPEESRPGESLAAASSRPAAMDGMPTIHLPSSWAWRVAAVDIAFQPIVNIHTGHCYGFECLLREVERAGFASIQIFFDEAYRDGVLNAVSLAVRMAAIEKFVRTGWARDARIFFNLDNREFESEVHPPASVAEALAAFGLPPATVCFELSERHEFSGHGERAEAFMRQRDRLHRIAIDDFGTGFAGLQLLYRAEPDFIKIDRFFISEVAVEPKKRLFVNSIVGIAHVLGVTVIAEGVETLGEFYMCREIGCDLVQGFFVQRPTTDVGDLRLTYTEVEEASRTDLRRNAGDDQLILSRVQLIPALPVGMEMSEVLACFRRDTAQTFFPVVNDLGEPVGILRESALRQYAYSMYGKDLLRNRQLRHALPQLAVRCPIADVRMKAERILELFSSDEHSDGILVVDEMRYIGFLSATALLQIINEKNVLLARDQNPLSRLPGNTVIYEYVSEALCPGEGTCTFVYFDFDNFKPFNDKYGFRAGDRAIQLFAEMLQKTFMREDRLVGHIGGDDFFVGFRDADLGAVCHAVIAVIRRFGEDVLSLYDAVDRQAGAMIADDREGVARSFPLLSVSAAVLHITAGPARGPMDGIIAAIARLKQQAKLGSRHIEVAVLRSDNSIVALGAGEAAQVPM